MKLPTLSALLLVVVGATGCATYSTYDNLGGYYGPAPRSSYSVGISYGNYAPMYQPIYRPIYRPAPPVYYGPPPRPYYSHRPWWH